MLWYVIECFCVSGICTIAARLTSKLVTNVTCTKLLLQNDRQVSMMINMILRLIQQNKLIHRTPMRLNVLASKINCCFRAVCSMTEECKVDGMHGIPIQVRQKTDQRAHLPADETSDGNERRSDMLPRPMKHQSGRNHADEASVVARSRISLRSKSP